MIVKLNINMFLTVVENSDLINSNFEEAIYFLKKEFVYKEINFPPKNFNENYFYNFDTKSFHNLSDEIELNINSINHSFFKKIKKKDDKEILIY